MQFSAKVDGMRKFVMINSLAVIKITKKHDKQPHVKEALQTDMVAMVLFFFKKKDKDNVTLIYVS